MGARSCWAAGAKGASAFGGLAALGILNPPAALGGLLGSGRGNLPPTAKEDPQAGGHVKIPCVKETHPASHRRRRIPQETN